MSDDYLAERARQRLGTTIKQKWKLDQLLGVGGTAAVYAATHRIGRRAAIKVLHPEHALNPEFCTRFLREAYVANAIEHPGAVSVLDTDVDDDGSVFLIMELLEGETLERRLERRGRILDPAYVLSVSDKLLDVLVAAHDKGITHRDIKPDNVFLTRAGQVKVLDFGIAYLAEISAQAAHRTRIGYAMGTPAFMPPEQARGDWEAVDAQSDVWATGALMFTSMTGRAAHEGRNINELLVSAATRATPLIGSIASSLHPAVVEVVDRALAFHKSDRWPHARMMQRALREAYWAMVNRAPPNRPYIEAADVQTLSSLVRAASVTEASEDKEPIFAPAQELGPEPPPIGHLPVEPAGRARASMTDEVHDRTAAMPWNEGGESGSRRPEPSAKVEPFPAGEAERVVSVEPSVELVLARDAPSEGSVCFIPQDTRTLLRDLAAARSSSVSDPGRAMAGLGATQVPTHPEPKKSRWWFRFGVMVACCALLAVTARVMMSRNSPRISAGAATAPSVAVTAQQSPTTADRHPSTVSRPEMRSPRIAGSDAGPRRAPELPIRRN